MDFAPEATKNNCLTNALNATLVTMNGNELQLQNDMGNAETKAKLPDGFIPLGTTELGGIIYIVSYNPKDKKSQIGSFPSPQRYSSTESNTKDKTWNISRENTEQILLSDQIFNPGDQFVYVVDKNKLTNYLYNSTNNLNQRFIKASVGLLTEDNKIIKLQDVSNFFVTDVTKPNYQTITCKFSGRLVLILEKVLYYPNVSIKCLVDQTQHYILYLKSNLTNSNNEEFEAVGIQITLTIDNISRIQYIWQSSKDFNAEIDITQLFDNTIEVSSSKILVIEVIPISASMAGDYNVSEGDHNGILLKTCAYSTNVDLSKVNSGLVEMPIYNYLVSDKQVNINYGFNIFTKPNQKVANIRYSIFNIEDGSPKIMSQFKELMCKQQGNLDLSFNTNFKENNLYVIKFTVWLLNKQESKDHQLHHIYFYRWLYTNTLFNQYSGKYNDFNEKFPDLNIQAESNLQYNSQTVEVKDIVPGLYLKKGSLTEHEATAKSTYNLETTLVNNTITLTSDYAKIEITTPSINGQFSENISKEIAPVSFSSLNNVIFVNNFKDTVSNVEAQKIFSIKSFDVDKPLVFCPMSYANYISQDVPSDDSLSVKVSSEDGSDKSALEVWSSKYIGDKLSSFDELTIGRVGYAITLSPELKKGENAVGISQYSSLYKDTGNDSSNRYERIYCIFAPAVDGANSVLPCLIKISDAESLNQTEQNSGQSLLRKVLDTIYTYRDISISGFQQANPIDYKTQCLVNGSIVVDESIPYTITLNQVDIDIKINNTNLQNLVDCFKKDSSISSNINLNNVTIAPKKELKIFTNVYRKYLIPSTLMQYTPEISEYIALDPNGVNAYFFNGISKDSEGNKTQPYRFIDHKTMNKLTINNSNILSELKLNDTYYFNPSIIKEIRLVEDLPYLVFNAGESNLATFELSGGGTHPVLTRHNSLEFIYKKNANKN